VLATSESFAPSRAKKWALFGLGLLLALVAFGTTLAIGPLQYHPARTAELAATVDAFQRTGVLLIKDTGSGSSYTQAPNDAPLSPAAWDDDPGSYLSASLVVGVAGVDDPFRALVLLQALLVAVPMLWLPWTLAALFRRTRAGLAAAVLPLVVPLLKGAPLALLAPTTGSPALVRRPPSMRCTAWPVPPCSRCCPSCSWRPLGAAARASWSAPWSFSALLPGCAS